MKEENITEHPEFRKITDKMIEIHRKKNTDYGGGDPFGNFREALDFNVSMFKGVLIRLSDKYSRLKSLSRKKDYVGEFEGESIEDTLIDLANYSIIALIMYREERGKKG